MAGISRDALIPNELVEEMAELGVFGLTDPVMAALAWARSMCVVTEELRRGWVGAGSLGTRSEIGGELIRLAGTEEQKQMVAEDRDGRGAADGRDHRAQHGL